MKKTKIEWVKDPVKDVVKSKSIIGPCSRYTCRPVYSCEMYCGVFCDEVEGPF